jgi:hypothetical protein
VSLAPGDLNIADLDAMHALAERLERESAASVA